MSPPAGSLLGHSILRHSSPDNDDVSQRAARDALIIKRINELQQQGIWSPKRLAKIPELPRARTHWDFLLEEAIWMSDDFREERKWKMAIAKKLAHSAAKYHKMMQTRDLRRQAEISFELRKVASFIAREIKGFWNKMEKIIRHKQEAQMEIELSQERDKQLEILVGQTERYSSRLAKDLSKSTSTQKLSSSSSSSSSPSSSAPPPLSLVSPSSSTEAETDSQASMTENEESNASNAASRRSIIAAAAESASKTQPTGITLQTTQVKTKVPFLLRGTMREYQHIGLDWLVSMFDAELNGILADEMGLGKTIMTISLLAHLACERQSWGPHLIIVPTSVILNWEREFKRWCPSFKILCYYGSQKERKQKRLGWNKPNSFHICITSYNLAIQDVHILRRKKWRYMILDEAQNIKNFRSQRWQTLLSYRSKRRLLLTGTPLQNHLLEVWSLMHFLMPHIFQSHSEFREWFCNPVNSMVEGNSSVNEQLISRLHAILRPFLLRRLKKDVEKQLPQKYEHIVPCSLSRRQRFLYDEFMARSQTKSILSSGNFLGILNVLMQLRKVCNHPDLFEHRPIVSPFLQESIVWHTSSLAFHAIKELMTDRSNSLRFLNLQLTGNEEHSDFFDRTFFNPEEEDENDEKILRRLTTPHQTYSHGIYSIFNLDSISALAPKPSEFNLYNFPLPSAASHRTEVPSLLEIGDENAHLKIYREEKKARELKEWTDVLEQKAYINSFRTQQKPLMPCKSLLRRLTLPLSAVSKSQHYNFRFRSAEQYLEHPSSLGQLVLSMKQRIRQLQPMISNFVCLIPPVATTCSVKAHCSHLPPSGVNSHVHLQSEIIREIECRSQSIREISIRQQLAFPAARLIQYDCGKLQVLDLLLRKLKQESHRVLIFTQMTKVLDILEIFLNLHGHTYLRLDGSTRPETRQHQMDRFNMDPKIFVFILSTRSGGFGINLTGADTVIFFDSDWNPAMDAQAQDRCHRIGQTREVHIYRLITQHTIEENILRKANQKRLLDKIAIDGGNFTTDFFQKVDLNQIVSDSPAPSSLVVSSLQPIAEQAITSSFDLIQSASQDELEQAIERVEDDESDVVAMRQAQKEIKETSFEFSEEFQMTESQLIANEKSQSESIDISDQLLSRMNPIQR